MYECVGVSPCDMCTGCSSHTHVLLYETIYMQITTLIYTVHPFPSPCFAHLKLA